MDIVTESLKQSFDEMAMKLITFTIVILAAYSIPYLLLGLIRLPHFIKHSVSVLVVLGAFYFSFARIFT
ncbi:hypothetical protein D1B33_07525 [Lysinibacillus yapensis]|uniref:Uncharacterized protein n=1 Tax=Ureibacillus yapensis TaxID=2304605 RepID=A0A396SBL3_9BACL|nr:hypothetical protein [Lysinibacillus yapensis]RHW38714.1 hypothetical protein D1B33_07525 [Lysinibacillus yapensis]